MSDDSSIHRICDDSGLLALVDPDAYDSSAGRQWSFDHFRAAMQREEMVVWGTGREGTWTVEVTRGRADDTGARTVKGPLTISEGRLLLVSWTQLTMATQFEDVDLAEADQDDALLFDPGRYCCRIVHRSLGGEGADTEQTDKPDMTLSLTNRASDVAPWDDIPWQ